LTSGAGSGRVAVLADAHIGGPGGSSGPLVEQLDTLPSEGCAHLVLLGDLFQVWVGSPKFETDDVRQICAALERLGQAGVRLDYVEGNRDFFLVGSCYERLFDRVALSLTFSAGDRRFLAVHGDGLDPSDRKYRFWNRLSKSRLSRALWLGLPAALARYLAEGTERRLADTNFRHKIRIPEEVLAVWAAGRFEEGFDEVLLGHFHQPRSFEVQGGVLRLVDAWFNTRQIEWLD
jgi:UDP-2,3-diacylglucosamine hydrolase